MAVGRPMPPLVLSDDEVQQLQSIANSRSLPHSIVQRSHIVLACGAGETNTAIAMRMGLTGMTVGKGRKRYRDLGLKGLHDELRPGRPRTYENDKVAEVINRALQSKPADGSTQWTAPSLAAATGISKSTAHRWLQTFSLQPHRQKSFKPEREPWRVSSPLGRRMAGHRFTKGEPGVRFSGSAPESLKSTAALVFPIQAAGAELLKMGPGSADAPPLGGASRREALPCNP